jgi:hypothetical protein
MVLLKRYLEGSRVHSYVAACTANLQERLSSRLRSHSRQTAFFEVALPLATKRKPLCEWERSAPKAGSCWGKWPRLVFPWQLAPQGQA